ncbi:MAG: flagellar basal body rod protein FlgB [Clostridiaceae bacterium]
MINKISNYELIKKSLDATTARSRVINNNIANINTKGYKRSYVEFEDKLKDAIGSNKVMIKTSDEKHIKSSSSNLDYEIKKDTTTFIRTDGNNVDIENEMINLSANNLWYNFLADRAKGKLSTMRFLINDGKR